MTGQNIGGSVLGASVSIAAGVASLPYTGDVIYGKILSLAAITLGVICLVSFLTSRLITTYLNAK